MKIRTELTVALRMERMGVDPEKRKLTQWDWWVPGDEMQRREQVWFPLSSCRPGERLVRTQQYWCVLGKEVEALRGSLPASTTHESWPRTQGF